jgi:hypothetical protein
MAFKLFNPFENLNFEDQTCFLTGEKITPEEVDTVFPSWILERYSLSDKKFTLMDQITSFRYADLKIPCAKNVVVSAINPLEEEIKKAFSGGYDEVIKLRHERLFQWMVKIIYGVLYHDLQAEKKRAARRNVEFKLSALLTRRFSLLHLMLQSLVVRMKFSERKPWSIFIFKSKISKDVFNYKDEPTNLNFSVTMNNFGIVACLQDNGAVGEYQQDIVNKFSEKILHPIQLEEIFARFIYSNYLLKKTPQYKIEEREDHIYVESIPFANIENDPLFGPWDEGLFAQVLADYWKPWGLTKKDIYEFPNSPISFLENEFNNEIIEPDSIELPY